MGGEACIYLKRCAPELSVHLLGHILVAIHSVNTRSTYCIAVGEMLLLPLLKFEGNRKRVL